MLRGFYAETGIRVQLLAYTDQEYKAKFPLWLTAEHSPDLLYWQGAPAGPMPVAAPCGHWMNCGKRRIGKLASARPCSESSRRGHLCPTRSYYHWGIFYSKRTLQRVGLTPPTTWSQLLQGCTRLRQQGSPRSSWAVRPVASPAWFDYLNLRLNGLAFHQRDPRPGRLPGSAHQASIQPLAATDPGPLLQ